MIRRNVLILTLMGAALVMAVPTSSAAQPKACAVPTDGTVVKRTRSAVVYRVYRAIDRPFATSVVPRTRQYVGCLKSKGRRYPLAHDGDDDFTIDVSTRFTLAGRWVASTRTSLVLFDAGRIDYVELIDLRSGKLLSVRLIQGPVDPVTSIAVSASGRLAWIVRPISEPSSGSPPRYPAGVYALVDGEVQAVDTKAADFEGLRLDGGILRWTSDGNPREQRVGAAPCTLHADPCNVPG